MPIFSNNPMNYLDRQRTRIEHLETIYCEEGYIEIKVNRSPVTVQNGLYNFWAWVSPISEYTQFIRANGGYYKRQL